MPFVHGKDAFIRVGTVDLTPFVTEWSFSQETDMAETSTMGSEAKSYVSGLTDATMSVSGNYDSTVATGPDVTLGALLGSEVASAFEVGPEGGTAGRTRYSGTAFLTGYEISAPVGDVVTFSADFQVTGPVVRGAFA